MRMHKSSAAEQLRQSICRSFSTLWSLSASGFKVNGETCHCQNRMKTRFHHSQCTFTFIELSLQWIVACLASDCLTDSLSKHGLNNTLYLINRSDRLGWTTFNGVHLLGLKREMKATTKSINYDICNEVAVKRAKKPMIMDKPQTRFASKRQKPRLLLVLAVCSTFFQGGWQMEGDEETINLVQWETI